MAMTDAKNGLTQSMYIKQVVQLNPKSIVGKMADKIVLILLHTTCQLLLMFLSDYSD